MNLNNGDVTFHDIEARKAELMRQAQIERLAQTACDDPARAQHGWKRLIAVLLDTRQSESCPADSYRSANAN